MGEEKQIDKWFEAARTNNLRIMERMLKRGVIDVNARDSSKRNRSTFTGE